MHFSAKRGIAVVYCLSVCLSVRNRDCNPGAVFSIPGFGIDASGIPGSRKRQSFCELGTLPALLTAIMHHNWLSNFRVGSQMAIRPTSLIIKQVLDC